ncbi:MAG TPA: hypothetical protein VFB79_21405 [Candidatus Angelobacter sp.]|nr:hypothetical protein [Candidatus Angelobacter sp.]
MLDKLWDCKHVIIYNTAGDFGNGTRGAGRPLKPLPGFRFIFSMSELAAYLLQAKQENWQKVRVCFTPLRNPAMEAEEVVIRGKKYPMKMALFITACDLVRDFGDCVFAVDEIWNFQNAAWSPDVLNELMLQWRHYGLTLAYTAQIPQKVDKTLLTVSTEIYCGRLNLENDLNAVRRNARIPEDAMRLLPNLPDWQFVHRFENGTWKLERP